MRVTTAIPRRRFRRGWIVGAAVLLLVVVFSLRGLAGFYTDFLWFDSVGQGATWRGLLAAHLVPAVVLGAVLFVVLFGNLVVAGRFAPTFSAVGPDDEAVTQFRVALGPYLRWARLVVSVFFGVISGV